MSIALNSTQLPPLLQLRISWLNHNRQLCHLIQMDWCSKNNRAFLKSIVLNSNQLPLPPPSAPVACFFQCFTYSEKLKVSLTQKPEICCKILSLSQSVSVYKAWLVDLCQLHSNSQTLTSRPCRDRLLDEL